MISYLVLNEIEGASFTGKDSPDEIISYSKEGAAPFIPLMEEVISCGLM